MTTQISIVVPCYNEEAALPYFFEEIRRVAEQMTGKEDGLSFEFLFVDDGSRDGTLPPASQVCRGGCACALSVLFREILGRKLPCMPAWSARRAILWP